MAKVVANNEEEVQQYTPSLQHFVDYVTNSGVRFDDLSNQEKGEWRGRFDRYLDPPSPGKAIFCPSDFLCSFGP